MVRDNDAVALVEDCTTRFCSMPCFSAAMRQRTSLLSPCLRMRCGRRFAKVDSQRLPRMKDVARRGQLGQSVWPLPPAAAHDTNNGTAQQQSRASPVPASILILFAGVPAPAWSRMARHEASRANTPSPSRLASPGTHAARCACSTL